MRLEQRTCDIIIKHGHSQRGQYEALPYLKTVEDRFKRIYDEQNNVHNFWWISEWIKLSVNFDKRLSHTMTIKFESQRSFVTFVYVSDVWERYRWFRTRIVPLLDPLFDKGCIGLARIWGTDVRPRSIVTWASAFNLLRYLGNDRPYIKLLTIALSKMLAYTTIPVNFKDVRVNNNHRR